MGEGGKTLSGEGRKGFPESRVELRPQLRGFVRKSCLLHRVVVMLKRGRTALAAHTSIKEGWNSLVLMTGIT